MNARHDEPPFDPYDDTLVADPTRTAEQATLGAMLLAPDKAIPAVTAVLRGVDYADPRHETVHDALLALHAAEQPIDPLTVAAHLTSQPAAHGRTQLDHIGGALYLHDLQTACPTPASADHYAEIVRLAARRRTLTTVGTKLAQLGRTGDAADLEHAYTKAYETLDRAVTDFGPAATLTPTTWSPVDLGPVLAGDYLDPAPTMLRRIDGIALLYDGGVHTVSGESESGKTWLTLLAALQLLQAGQQVVFVDFEDRADRVISRLLALGANPEQIRAGFRYIRPDRPLDDTGRAQLSPALAGVRLVILDGVTEAMTLHGFDLNSNEDSAKFQGLLPRWIADHGPAVVLIDHVVKDKEKQGRFAIGAQHKLAGIDGAAYVVKTIHPFARGKRGVAQVTVAKDRPGYVREQAYGKVIAEFALDGTFGDVTVIPELTPPPRSGTDTKDGPATFEPTHLMARISAYVAANPGLSKKAVENAINGRAATKRLALELLVTRGYVGTKAGAKNAVQHYSQKPYYEPRDDDPTDDDAPPQEEA